ncbi:N-6 DNA methylase [Streptomyces sp. H27-H1]|uniref:N-6 DNA methylase n=1 Tax=unclassified Streptomyces TaxID=2593676 RepID=UPI00226FBD99|nr:MULTISPECIES: N-6 DNA methylase [unclassified Streptomyces]MCY0931163.1 N-6 DNA methylase [Streptomyces sp. H27-H1]MCY0939242.1 N-6 DNA methylase [Streptomyces sp. H34-S4]
MTEQLDLFATFDAPAPTPAPATFSRPAPAPKAAATATARPAAPPARPAPARPHTSADIHSRAFTLGEAVTDAWNRAHGGTHIEVPIGIVAALALIQVKDPSGPDLKTQILAQSDSALIRMYREIWWGHWRARPDLIERARILHEWLNDEGEPDTHRMYAVRMATQAALRAGILDLTGHADPYMRSRTDVLSHVMMLLRSHGAQQGLGEYHTPPPVAEAVASVSLGVMWDSADTTGGPRPGQHIHDPAGGSGGLLRAAAQILRDRGHDPADFQWSMVDVDNIAAACGAVNAIVWQLGIHVTVACDNSLSNPRAVEDAQAQALAVIKHRDEIFGKAQIISGVRRAQQLLESVAA